MVRIIKMLAWLVAAILILIVGARVYFADLIEGPELHPTPAEISLKEAFPPPVGWSEDIVGGAFNYADSIGSTAVIMLRDGGIVAEWGATDQRISLHSVRKSLVGALYGIAVDRGLIDVSMTLGELGFDDTNPPLTDREKSARLIDLITARSGIYHPSVMDDNGAYPEPGSHAPNEEFFYNNWSFNALGGMFEILTELSLGRAFKDWIADPIGMQDFRVEDVLYFEGEESTYPAYRFWMSARDLARVGLLYMNEGRWEDVQVVPADWLASTFVAHSDLGDGLAYGYLWWTMPDSSYMATGTGGQKLRLYPDKGIVLVNRVDTGIDLRRAIWWTWGVRVNNTMTTEMLRQLEAGLEGIPR